MRVQHGIITAGSRKAAASNAQEDGAEDMSILDGADSATPANKAGASGVTGDLLGDELLELAEGEGSEFGLTKGASGESNLYTMSAEELGIQDRLQAESDTEEVKRSEAVLGRALRTWAKDMRERERSRKLRDSASRSRGPVGNGAGDGDDLLNGGGAASGSGAGLKRARANDYDSDSGDSMPDVSELRRSSRRNTRSSSAANGSRRRSSRFGTAGEDEADASVVTAGAGPGGSMEAAQKAIRNARNRYLVEKAKLRHARSENSRLWEHLQTLEAEQKRFQAECSNALEQALLFELGQDVDAIFTPPTSPRLQEAAAVGALDEQAEALRHELEEEQIAARGTFIDDESAAGHGIAAA